MARADVATLLSRRILEQTEFSDLYRAVESATARAYISADALTPHGQDMSSINALLRYADILSHSSEARHRNLAYGTISLLRELDSLVALEKQLRDRVESVSEAVLVQLGNFPGLRTLGKTMYYLPLERRIVRAAKELVQATNTGDAILTDAQFAIVEGLKHSDYFSFSGPTSLGKSFILKDAIYEIVQRPEMAGHSVVVMVPTKALIGQTAADLRTLFANLDGVNVAAYPSLPPFLRKRFGRTVFVFTPERLLRYLARPDRDVDYLFIDEAQRVIAGDDTRSSLFYHAISETTRRFATKLVFASPSIENPEIFLELFQKSPAGALTIEERTVSQQRYFVDLIEKEVRLFSGLKTESIELPFPDGFTSPLRVITSLSGGRKGIVYVNSSRNSAQMALELAKTLPLVHGPEIDKLIEYVTSYVHKEYYLAECLRHGVAFHHGKMPQEVRERVERCFASKSSGLRYVFCTSTLLEGVNMPAKNIFVLSDKHGNRNFERIDFENLVGRAGRLTHDFSGNVICVRVEADRWTGRTKDLIPQSTPIRAESFLVNPGKKKKAYTDIAKVLQGKPLAGKPSADAVRSVQQYASILLVQQLDQQATPLRTNFLEKVKDGPEVLRRSGQEVKTPADVLRGAPDILPKYQDRTLAFLQSKDIPLSEKVLVSKESDLADTSTFSSMLMKLADLYGWAEEESRGTDPLVPNEASSESIERRLWYWATLMKSWVRGDPLSRVISTSIRFHAARGEIKFRDYTVSPYLITEVFNRLSAKHINIVIEETLKDLEGGLRFRIIAYLQNYYELSLVALGDEAGMNVATLVEYGTTDPRSVELQEIGLSRHSANLLLNDYSSALRFDRGGKLSDIRAQEVLALPDVDEDLLLELANVMQVMG